MTTPPGPPPESSDRPDQPPQSYPPPPSRPNQRDQPAGLGGSYQSYPSGPGRPGEPYAGAARPDDPLVPADFGGWVRRVVGVIQRSFVPLALLALITAVASVLLGMIVVAAVPEVTQPGFGTPAAPLTPDRIGPVLGASYGTGLVGYLVGLVVQGAGLVVATRHAAGRPVTAGHGLAAVARRAGPLLGWGVLSLVLVAVGSILLLLPGLYLFVVFSASLIGVVMVEGDGLGRCFTLIRNRWWATFGRILFGGVLIGLYSLLVYGISLLFGDPYSFTALLVRAVLAIPATVALTAMITVLYAELRSHEHAAVGTPRLNAELDR